MPLIFMVSAVCKVLGNTIIGSASVLILLVLLLANGELQAAENYHYLHVTIDTVWKIFLFLLIGVFAPFVLMTWLYWRHAKRVRESSNTKRGHHK